jgi:3-dehydroquinate synthase
MKTVRVRTSKEYDVIIGAGLLDRAGEYIHNSAGGEIAAIVTDENVAALYLERIKITLRRAGYETVVFKAQNGEKSKNGFTYLRLLEFLAEKGVTRSDVIVALGGGVVGDLAGFAAATYMRGVSYAQIPTTMLAAVDSSIGGKTAIDLDGGKNLVGAFHQPKIVICDRTLLEMLPPRIFVEGCAEVIKYAVIVDDELFRMLESGLPLDLEEIITRCVRIKRDIVSEDEHETGTRRLLSFGHTVGHAIERLSDYKISHGNAISIGMAIETLAAVRMGMCGEECYRELVDLLHKFGLPYKTRYRADDMVRAALSDKKRKSNMITLVFPRRIGKCVLLDVEVGKLEQLFAAIHN